MRERQREKDRIFYIVWASVPKGDKLITFLIYTYTKLSDRRSSDAGNDN